MTPDPAREACDPVHDALCLYQQFLDRGSAPDEGALALAQQIVTAAAMMTAADHERFLHGARLLRQDAIRREREKDAPRL